MSLPSAATVPRVLSLVPPMTQLNTPYPATTYLTGFLRARGVDAHQDDLAIALVLALLAPDALDALKAEVDALPPARRGAATTYFAARFDDYRRTMAPTLAFLQGRDATLAHRIATRRFLPEGPRFASLDAFVAGDGDPAAAAGDAMAWAFGSLGVADRARHLATLYLNDVADVLAEAADPRFAFVRYAESLALSAPSFDALAAALAAPPTRVDRTLQALVRDTLARHRPTLVLLSVPFPGTVYGALRIAQTVKAIDPSVAVALGGGYVNTELRELTEPRLFDAVDFVCLDAGERPLLALLEHLQGRRSAARLVRTFVRDAASGAVRWCHFPEPEVPFDDTGTPTWDGLPRERYLSLLDLLNPMHRLWSDGRWNKLTVAHGCYWKRCSFCDVGLDYIGRYEAASTGVLVDRIESLVAETGVTGFHFVDEAAPPRALKALAAELRQRRLAISWWGNVRFEKTFTPQLARELADSGCIAISGGLEVASDRLLALMQKGVTVDQVARVTKGFADAGVRVHAYLMYGFPTQTEQDTVDALELVRQLFAAGCIHSAFWHRFACTVHSPVGQRPQDFGVTLVPAPHGGFARNDVAFVDATGVDHDALGPGLKKALYNYLHGIGLDLDVRHWWDRPMPKARVNRRRIEQALLGVDAASTPPPVPPLASVPASKPAPVSGTRPGKHRAWAAR